MWNKLTGDNFRRGISQVKNHLSVGYGHARRFATKVDQGVDFTKRLFSVLAPVIDSLGGGNLNRKAIQGLGAYEKAKAAVVDADEKGKQELSQFVGHLRSAVPEIGL